MAWEDWRGALPVRQLAEPDDPCPGLHPRPAAADARRLEWVLLPQRLGQRPPVRGAERTCGRCGPVAYEFGVVWGCYRVVRLRWGEGRVWVTPEVPRRVAARWWEELLAGRAV